MNGLTPQSTTPATTPSSHPDDAKLRFEQQWLAVVISISLLFLLGGWINFLILGEAEIVGWPRLAIIGILMWFAQRSKVVILAMALLLSVIFRETRGFRGVVFIDNIVFVMMSLGLLYWSGRYEKMRHGAIELALRAFVPTPSNKPLPATLGIKQILQTPFIKIVFVWFLIAGVASLIYATQPLVGNESQWIPWTIQSRHILWPGPFFIACVVGVYLIVQEWVWRFKTPQQMRMALRSTFVSYEYADLRRLAKYRIHRAMRQKVRNRTKQGDPKQAAMSPMQSSLRKS